MVPVGRRQRVLVVGRTTLDIFVRFTTFPAPGTEAAMPRPKLTAGGGAANTAAVLSALGADVTLWTRLGRDAAGRIVCEVLAGYGLAMDGITFDPCQHTTTSVINVHPDGEIAILQHQGATSMFRVEDHLLDRLGTFAVVFIGGALKIDGFDGEPMARFLQQARERGVYTAVSVSRNTYLREQLLPSLVHMDLLVANRREVSEIAQASSVEESCEWLHSRGVRTVVVTLGAAGALVSAGRTSHSVEGLPVGVVDTTGCGDAFVAGYLDAQMRGLSPAACVEWANAVGAHNARTLGAIPPSVERREIQALLERYQRYGACAALVLAGGQSRRMEGVAQKLTLDLCGKPLIGRCIEVLRRAGIPRIVVVLGHEEEAVRYCLRDEPVEFVSGGAPQGTGAAVRTALTQLPGLRGQVFVVNGDTPLVRVETLEELHLAKEDRRAQGAACTAVSRDSVRYGHGVIVRDKDGEFRGIEHLDPASRPCRTPEVNTGVYVFDGDVLRSAVDRIPVASDGNVHFSDVLAVLRRDGHRVLLRRSESFEEFISVNTPQDFAEVREILCARESAKGDKV